MTYEDYIASIGATAATYAPRNTALCEGQIMSIQQNTALFSLMGTTYGGDGRSTFGLPDLRGAVPVGTGPTIAGPNVVLGERFGTLTEQAWPTGWPAAVAPGQTATVPTASGPSGLALNWAISLYGYWPPRED